MQAVGEKSISLHSISNSWKDKNVSSVLQENVTFFLYFWLSITKNITHEPGHMALFNLSSFWLNPRHLTYEYVGWYHLVCSTNVVKCFLNIMKLFNVDCSEFSSLEKSQSIMVVIFKFMCDQLVLYLYAETRSQLNTNIYQVPI